MEKKHGRQFVVNSKSEVPENFVPIVLFGPPNKKGNGTPEYMAIQRAWANGEISGCKWYRTPGDKFGPVFVNKDEAARLLVSLKDARATNEHCAAPMVGGTDAVDSAGIVSALRSMLFELRRIGNTLETLSQRAAHVEAATVAEGEAGGSYSPDGQWKANG